MCAAATVPRAIAGAIAPCPSSMKRTFVRSAPFWTSHAFTAMLLSEITTGTAIVWPSKSLATRYGASGAIASAETGAALS